MESLFCKSPQEIARILKLRKPFQGKQIWRHLYSGVTDFDAMTDLPLALRDELKERGALPYSGTLAARSEDSSGAVKLGVRLEDGAVVECVLLTDSNGERTACVSSQAGCAMGCRFCRTGTLGLKRNLKDCEIVEQFARLVDEAAALDASGEVGSRREEERVSVRGGISALSAKTGPKLSAGKLSGQAKNEHKPISHIVFMGMGEPLANLEAVLSAISCFNNSDAYGLSNRRITISTCGLVPGIRELSRRGVPVKLAVSLVSADDGKRSLVMPVNKAFPLRELREALMDFQAVSGRRFTFEYCMIQGFNIGKPDADALARFCRGFEVVVNLIPFNPCPELPYQTPTDAETRCFCRMLDERGVKYTIRISRGRGVQGACGQLAGRL